MMDQFELARMQQIQTGQCSYKKVVAGGVTYEGWAFAVGVPEDLPLWRVRRTTVDNGTTTTAWADGDNRPDNEVTDMSALVYEDAPEFLVEA